MEVLNYCCMYIYRVPPPPQKKKKKKNRTAHVALIWTNLLTPSDRVTLISRNKLIPKYPDSVELGELGGVSWATTSSFVLYGEIIKYF